MTSKTSFFNFGIYKSTIKRYLWGAVLYFVLLFMFTGMALFLNVDMFYGNETAAYWKEHPLILNDSYIAVPMLLAVFVPTVTALLVFRFLHSKNQTVYTHSLPISRRANFVSQTLAAFTLMLVPVILNTVILMLTSLGRYGEYFTVYDCITWGLCNIYAIFLMFSCASLAAFLTGSTFGMIAVNVLIHSFLVIAAATLGVMAEMFVYGYSPTNTVIELVSRHNFFTVTLGMCSVYFTEDLTLFQIVGYALCALILYVLSYVLYKKRKLENVGDISGFKCLNHIFKYIVCFLATMCAFATFSSYMQENPAAFAVIILITSIVSYAASEMVLKKTLKIMYSWKGYAIYAVCFCLLFSVFYSTTFFGYETRIPKKDEVAKVFISNQKYRQDEVITDNARIIDTALNAHFDIIKGEPIPKYKINNIFESGYSNLYIEYTLKDGSTLERDYTVKSDKCREIMDTCYEVDEYKILAEEVFTEDNRIRRILLNNHEQTELKKDEILPLIREDIMNLGFSELYPWTEEESYPVRYYIHMEYIQNNPEDVRGGGIYLSGAGISVTDRYEKTCEYLKNLGYLPLN